MNTVAYIVYLLITYIITIHAGFIFYNNGRVYILQLFHGDERLTTFINRVLLTGYYLLNLGYAALMIRWWRTIHTWTELLTSVGYKAGAIMLTLALIHFLNMAVILAISQRHHHFYKNKNIRS